MLELYLAHRAALVDFAAPIVGCRVRAEDVAQEAYLRFATLIGQDHPKQDQIAQPVGYLYRIVRNLAVDWVRRLSAEKAQGSVGEPLESVAAAVPSPEQEVLCREQLRLVAKALAELPARTQLAFELHHLCGYTLQEIANECGISVTLAHQLVHRAASHCANRLGDSQA
jgi:RNA polymerase sigma factor (sigma-70 family)